MVVDVSHLSAHGLAHLAEVALAPFVASHSSCRALCDHPRNLTDEQLRLVAGSGGFIAINATGRFVAASGIPTIDQYVDHVEHAAATVGDGAVAIGADFIADLLDQVDPILGRQLLRAPRGPRPHRRVSRPPPTSHCSRAGSSSGSAPTVPPGSPGRTCSTSSEPGYRRETGRRGVPAAGAKHHPGP